MAQGTGPGRGYLWAQQQEQLWGRLSGHPLAVSWAESRHGCGCRESTGCSSVGGHVNREGMFCVWGGSVLCLGRACLPGWACPVSGVGVSAWVGVSCIWEGRVPSGGVSHVWGEHICVGLGEGVCLSQEDVSTLVCSGAPKSLQARTRVCPGTRLQQSQGACMILGIYKACGHPLRYESISHPSTSSWACNHPITQGRG